MGHRGVAVRMLVASTLKRTLAGSIALTVLASLAMGFVLTIAAGARRTDSAFERFRAASNSADAIVNLATDDPIAAARRLDAGPGVTAAAGMMLLFSAPDGPGVVPGETANGFGGLHSTFGEEVQALRILEGRAADPEAEDEVTISRNLADLGGFAVGDRVPVASAQSAVDAEVTITGIHRWEFELAGQVPFPVAIFTPAFTERWLPAYVAANNGELPPNFFLVRLDDPSAVGQRRFVEWVEGEFGEDVAVNDATTANETIRGSLQVQSVSLVAVALFAAIATVLILAQVSERSIGASSNSAANLLALGMTRTQRSAALAAPIVVSMIGAGVLAALAAIAASPLMPLGFARTVEPSPGVRVDALLTIPLAALMVVAVCARSVVAAFTHADATHITERSRPLPLPARLSTPARVGVQRALVATSRSARGASRSAIAAVMVAVAGSIAVVTFTASERHLFTTPRSFGWSFDTAAMENQEVEGSLARLLDEAERLDAVGDYGTAFVGVGSTSRGDVEVMSFTSVRGDIHPALLRGRPALAADELVVGARLADELDLAPGDTLGMYAASGEEHPMTVVGVAVLPGIGESEFGFAVAVSASGAETLGVEWGTRAVVAAAAAGFSRSDVSFEGADAGEQVDPFLPPTLLNLERAGDAPSLLFGFLVLLGAGAVGHALVVTVRRSRREAATLRCIGFVRNQVVASVAWQSAVYAAIGVIVGVPVGVLLGRTAWGIVASGLGVQNIPSVPVSRIVEISAGTLLLAIATAVAPAWSAARTSPTSALRSE